MAATEHVDDHSRSHDLAIWLPAQQPKTRGSMSRAAANEGWPLSNLPESGLAGRTCGTDCRLPRGSSYSDRQGEEDARYVPGTKESTSTRGAAI